MKWVSLGQSQGVDKAAFLLEAQKENSLAFPSFWRLLMALGYGYSSFSKARCFLRTLFPLSDLF